MRNKDKLWNTLQEVKKLFAYFTKQEKDRNILARCRSAQREMDEFYAGYFDFREIADNLFDGIFISDGKGKVVFVNEAYCKFTNITKEEILGRDVEEVCREGVLFTGAVTPMVLREKKTMSSIGKIVRLNKEVLATGGPIFDKNGDIELIAVSTRDISELKRLENKLENLKNSRLKIDEEIRFLKNREFQTKRFVFQSKKMAAISDTIDSIAQTDVTVLITGESGTGKELIANEIFLKSQRVDKPFIKINCAAIPLELLESELFGYEGGAFTNSNKSGKIGMFEVANEGTILLDEIGELPLNLQTKLLRAIQHKEISRIGGTKPIKLDIRILASTNQNLPERIKSGKFREDLYYRLNVIPIKVPPLRERSDDIPLLTKEFLNVFNKKYSKNIFLSETALEILRKYSWPGNIRELENVIERLVVVSTGDAVREIEISKFLSLTAEDPESTGFYNLKEAVRILETEMITKALRQFGTTRKAAEHLAVDQSTVVKKCKTLGIDLQKLKD